MPEPSNLLAAAVIGLDAMDSGIAMIQPRHRTPARGFALNVYETLLAEGHEETAISILLNQKQRLYE